MKSIVRSRSSTYKSLDSAADLCFCGPSLGMIFVIFISTLKMVLYFVILIHRYLVLVVVEVLGLDLVYNRRDDVVIRAYM